MKNQRFFLTLLLISIFLAPMLAQGPHEQANALKKELPDSASDTATIRLRYQAGSATGLMRVGYWDSVVAGVARHKLYSLFGRSLYWLGQACLANGLLDKAFDYSNKSYSIAKIKNDTAGMLPALLALTRVSYVRNELKKALDYCYTGRKIAETLHDTLNIANFYMEEGLCSYSSGNTQKALALHLKCNGIYTRLHNDRGIAGSLLELGSDYLASGRLDSASSCYLASKKYARKFGNSVFAIEIYNSVGAGYNMRDQFDSAWKYCSLAHDIALRNNYKLRIIGTLVSMVSVAKCSGNIQLAQKMAEEAAVLLKPINYKLQTLELAHASLEIYVMEKDYKKAMEAQQLYYDTRDSLTSENNRKQSIEKEFDYNLEKKESENRLLGLELRQDKYIFAGMAILLVLILLIAWLLFRQNTFRNEQKSALLEQKLLRVQMNPHFIFNSLQAIQSFIISRDVKEAVRYMGSFATVTRHVLENSRTDYIPLNKEIDLLKSYLHLQKLRFGKRFDYLIHVAENVDAEHISIPPMMLQPFIENAVEHGMHDIESGGMIEIWYSLKNSMLLMEIIDNGHGMTDKSLQNKQYRSLAREITGERIALMNARKKIKISFVVTDAFPESMDRKGVKVSFLFPVEE